MNDIDRARWRRPAAVDAHADNHGQAPSADERKTAIEYLRGDDYSGRQSLVHAALEIAAERLYGTLLGGGLRMNRCLDIYERLRPHTAEKPEQESEEHLDLANRGPIRSDDAAYTAAKMLVEALDEHHRRHYGVDSANQPKRPTAESVERRTPPDHRGRGRGVGARRRQTAASGGSPKR